MNLKFGLKKKVLSSVLAAGLVLTPVSMFGASGSVSAASAVSAQTTAISVTIDGSKLALNPSPVSQKGTTLVPMRSIFQALHSSVTWEANTKTIFAVKSSTRISLQIGSKSAIINGKAIALTAAPQQMNGATMVPLRFIAEALGAEVEYNAAQRIIRITSSEAILKKKMDEAAKAQEALKPKLLTTEQNVQKNDGKVVMITTDKGLGSGVVIDTDEILTNYHVIADAEKATATLVNGKQVEIEGIVGYDEDYDLAVLKTKTPLNIEPVDVGLGVTKGEHVVAIGSPQGVQNTVSEGIISNVSTAYGDPYEYQISVPIDHGSSGGGLFNDYGELVGITSAGIDDTQADLNFAVSSMHIYLLMYDIEDKAPSKIGFLPSDMPDSLKDASLDRIREFMEDHYAEIQSSQGTTELKSFEVTRDADGWLVIKALIDPSFYMIYGHAASEDLRYWAIDAGSTLRKLLPDDNIQMTVYYEQTFSFEPRGFDADEVTKLEDGKWRVRFPVIDYQGKDHAIVRVNA
ncbi:trypsin-like serine protease [Paenibacillus rhizovicinus]|uniref:Trypsin-like serine protease n=1 Tax=Paenibacillus rhizovicinus TaxID=2704463 RepID=A0A6C0P496_9BACL|nr:stalk domain-containing protein [Paenibacillus rhizovicinus]QHW33265.1 trypsin-like serine protease [Paenibacillus rhizovicinus]